MRKAVYILFVICIFLSSGQNLGAIPHGGNSLMCPDVLLIPSDPPDSTEKERSPGRHGEKIFIDSLVVLKAERKMMVYSNHKLIKTYHIALGPNSIGAKEFQGDGKTPEGLYYIDDRNPNSDFHKNLGISYPNAEDYERGIKYKRPLGGDIKIHGYPNGYTLIQKLHLAHDWTAGCIAVTNKEIDELFETVKIGSPIIILP